MKKNSSEEHSAAHLKISASHQDQGSRKGGFLGNNPRNPKLLINTYYKVSKSKLAIRHNYGLIKTHYNTGGWRDNTKHSYTCCVRAHHVVPTWVCGVSFVFPSIVRQVLRALPTCCRGLGYGTWQRFGICGSGLITIITWPRKCGRQKLRIVIFE